MYWSDRKKRSIEVLDLYATTRYTLVHKLNAPGSMSVDPEHGYLFWCNYESIGSIERIDLDGKHR